MMDRENIKWTSLMLPEHKQLLRDFYVEQTHEGKPLIDSQAYEEWNELLHEAIQEDRCVKFKVYQDHSIQQVEGKIIDWNGYDQFLKIIDEKGEFKKISIGKICGIQ